MSQNRTGPAQVNCAHNGHESHEGTRRSNDVVALDELGLLSGSRAKAGVGKKRPSGSDYCAAFSSFALVWKMACHPPFSFFQTDPALKVPEASFPS